MTLTTLCILSPFECIRKLLRSLADFGVDEVGDFYKVLGVYLGQLIDHLPELSGVGVITV